MMFISKGWWMTPYTILEKRATRAELIQSLDLTDYLLNEHNSAFRAQ